MNCNFTYKHYVEMLELAKKKGYKILPLCEYNPKHKKVIYLRHDVDTSPEKAETLAFIEKSMGIKSSYFILLHGDFNPLSFQNLNYIKLIQSLGHEIGLHYFNMGIDIQTEKRILESVLNKKIKGFCCHEPTRCGGFNMKAKGLYNAYEDRFLKDIKYISDSGARWRDGCLCKFLNDLYPRICVLIHPEWWYKNNPLERF